MWSRQELKSNAKVTFKANYWKCVLVGLIALIASGGISLFQNVTKTVQNGLDGGVITESYSVSSIGSLPALLIMIFLFNVITIGVEAFFIANAFDKAGIENLAIGFKEKYGRNVVTMLLRSIFTFLWSLLLIVPGIIKAYEYRMIPYILADRPELDRKDVFALSKKMMMGNKWNAFVLDLSFLGWQILGGLTLGILDIFYVLPYVLQTNANLYLALRDAQEQPQAEQTETI